MPLKRKLHWDTRHLHQFFLDTANTQFEWAKNDCCIFAANAIEAITGVDIADDFRGKYTDQLSALRLIATVTGGSTVADAAAHCATKHGLVEHAYPLMAKRGDLVVIDNGGTLIAGVVHLNGMHVISVGESGAVRLPITSVVRSWSLSGDPMSPAKHVTKKVG
jgi:hypothetical protein